jgi:hypothetical protein
MKCWAYPSNCDAHRRIKVFVQIVLELVMEVAVKEFVVVVGFYEFHHDHVSRTRMPNTASEVDKSFPAGFA